MDTKQPTIGISVSPLADWDVSHRRAREISMVQRRYLEELDPLAVAEKMLGHEPLVDTPGRRRTRNLLALMLHDVPVGDLRIVRNREDN